MSILVEMLLVEEIDRCLASLFVDYVELLVDLIDHSIWMELLVLLDEYFRHNLVIVDVVVHNVFVLVQCVAVRVVMVVVDQQV
jgi:hypothetical protein